MSKSKTVAEIDKVFGKWAWERPEDLELPGGSHEAIGYMTPQAAARAAFHAGFVLGTRLSKEEESTG